MDSFLKRECDLKFFHENGFFRKKCPSCNDYFWTTDENATLCGDQPCVPFSFINNPLGKKPMSLREVRESFLTYFERNGHTRLTYPETGQRCPVVARWRSDIYLTIASIADFQPHVTSGEVPPPANPLVISQPCIRLNDLEEVGKSGRHLTTFEMMGHHAFNKNVDEIYFKEKTVQFCDEYFTKEIGIPREYINYKEQLWDGGGNAGPCLEVLAAGLEIATLVFMNMKQDESGNFEINGKNYVPNPLNIVDTGYGLERIAWCTQGTKTVYDTVLPEMIKFLKENARVTDDMQSIFSLADHTKCLSFMLGDGIVPSNVKAGYLARLIIRRSLRFMEKLRLDIPLRKLVNMQLELLERDFPSLKLGKAQIDEVLNIETRRFSETLSKGEGLIRRIIFEKKTIDTEELVRLYDTHGMPPDVVKNIAKNEGITVKIPENFDSMIAELHSHSREIQEDGDIEDKSVLPETQRLYYKNHYIRDFDATVLWAGKSSNGMKVVLDKTAFYPEGGGQPGDIGTFRFNGKTLKVNKVEKERGAILHIIDGEIQVGEKIHGEIDWQHRYTLMKHHTGTHVVNGALRKLYGEHIWQAGSQLGTNEARFDFSHYKSIRDDELPEIERLANEFIKKAIPVEKKVMERNDAEREHGFRLYQGGVPPGNQIRVINIPGIDVEACGGTHIDNIKEIEKIRILKSERIQDGVNRIFFAAGESVDEYQKNEQKLYDEIVKILQPYYQIEKHEDVSIHLKETAKIFSVAINQVEKTLIRFIKESQLKQKTTVQTLTDASNHLFAHWKETQKKKKKLDSEYINQLREKAEIIPGTNVRVVTATTEFESTATAGAIISEPDYVAHIFDGKKITSAASENVDIDLTKEIAPVVGKILGGSGGGRPKITQSGGPNKEKAKEALEKAKELTIAAFN